MALNPPPSHKSGEVAAVRLAVIDPDRYRPEERISAREVRDWLGISPTTLWRWNKRGWLVGDATEISEKRYLASDVLKLLAQDPPA